MTGRGSISTLIFRTASRAISSECATTKAIRKQGLIRHDAPYLVLSCHVLMGKDPHDPRQAFGCGQVQPFQDPMRQRGAQRGPEQGTLDQWDIVQVNGLSPRMRYGIDVLHFIFPVVPGPPFPPAAFQPRERGTRLKNAP